MPGTIGCGIENEAGLMLFSPLASSPALRELKEWKRGRAAR